MAGVLHFTVLQKENAGPTPEQMKRAFQSFTHLTDADAVRLAVSARGILMRHLSHDQARAVQRALEAEGAAVGIVAERDLPSLPDSLALHRLEIWPQTLIIYDPFGRPQEISWRDISLIAAGAVLRVDFGKTQTELLRRRGRASGTAGPVPGAKPGHSTTSGIQYLLEFVLRQNAVRYEIAAADFEFKRVLDRPGLSTEEQFIWLTREFCRHAPHAALNSGARKLNEGGETVPVYSYQRVLLDEMVWLLWRQAQNR